MGSYGVTCHPDRGDSHDFTPGIHQKYRKSPGQTSPIFWRMLPLSVDRSSSDGMAICYILPVTSCSLTWRKWARIKHDVMFRRGMPDGGTSWTSDNYRVAQLKWGQPTFLLVTLFW